MQMSGQPGDPAAGLHCATLPCTRAEADAAAAAEGVFEGHEPQPSLVASEGTAGWRLELWTDGPPSAALLAEFAGLAPSAGVAPLVEAVAEFDWVTLSQQGLEPVNIGRVHLHTAEHEGKARAGQLAIRIDAGLAFGTGQHATTAGAVAATLRLAKSRRMGREPGASVLDVGTGSGVLAFVAHRLWKRARIVAADIDAVAVRVALENGRLNGVPIGRGRGRLELRTAPGVADLRMAVNAPYRLVFANILAGPLVALAPSLSATVARSGTLILAGLLASQASEVIAAYRARGFVLIERSRRAEWPVLVLKRVRTSGKQGAIRAARHGRGGNRSTAATI